MAFFPRSRSNFRPRRRMAMGARRGRRLRDPQRQKGLEVSPIFIEETTSVDNTSAGEEIVYTHLASIALSLQGANIASPSSEQRFGSVLGSSFRSIMLHGLVLDWGINQLNWAGDPPVTDGEVWTCFQLLTDRIDPDASGIPVPASIGNYSPFFNQWPVAVLSTTSPDPLQESVRMPTRIHWSQTRLVRTAASHISSPNEGTIYVPQGQEVSIRAGTINKRLRIRLDDLHGFFLGWFFRNSASFTNDSADTRVFRRWARGQLYYRVLT